MDLARGIGATGVADEVGDALLMTVLGEDGAKARRMAADGRMAACMIELSGCLVEGGWSGGAGRRVERVLDLTLWCDDGDVRGAGRGLLERVLAGWVRGRGGEGVERAMTLCQRWMSVALATLRGEGGEAWGKGVDPWLLKGRGGVMGEIVEGCLLVLRACVRGMGAMLCAGGGGGEGEGRGGVAWGAERRIVSQQVGAGGGEGAPDGEGWGGGEAGEGEGGAALAKWVRAGACGVHVGCLTGGEKGSEAQSMYSLWPELGEEGGRWARGVIEKVWSPLTRAPPPACSARACQCPGGQRVFGRLAMRGIRMADADL